VVDVDVVVVVGRIGGNGGGRWRGRGDEEAFRAGLGLL